MTTKHSRFEIIVKEMSKKHNPAQPRCGSTAGSAKRKCPGDLSNMWSPKWGMLSPDCFHDRTHVKAAVHRAFSKSKDGLLELKGPWSQAAALGYGVLVAFIVHSVAFFLWVQGPRFLLLKGLILVD